MVRNYKRKSKRGDWSQERMKKAVSSVLDKTMGYRKAAAFYEVPQSTLERRVKEMKETGSMTLTPRLGPIEPVFNDKEEKELAGYLKDMEARFFGLTTTELRKLAYDLAVRNGKKNNFNSNLKMAGKDWVKGFLNRHKDLSIRKPEATSAARAMGFNKVAVKQFFSLLAEIYDKHKLTPDRIYNSDETGMTTNSKTACKVIAKRGKKQVGALSSAERGKLVTVEICFSAAGSYVPPLLVYPRKRMKLELLNGAPPGAWARCSDTGWINTDIFLEWLKKFIEFSGATKSRPVLLLLDGHSTHTKSIDVIDLGRDNGVIMLVLPPHCSHRLQPLDVSFMKPLSAYYDLASKAWLRNHPGKVITVFQIAEIFGQAYIQSATMTTAINGFRKCGICPFNDEVFSDADFVAAETTDIQEHENIRGPSDVPSIPETETGDAVSLGLLGDKEPLPERIHENEPKVSSVSQLGSHQLNVTPTDPVPGCSFHSQLVSRSDNEVTPTKIIHDEVPRQACRNLSSSFNTISPREIMPIPKVIGKEKRKNYRRGKTVVLTSTPYKKELIETKMIAEEKKKIAEEKKKAAGERKKAAQEKKVAKGKQKIQDNTQVKQNNKKCTQKDSEEDCECLYCGGLYSESVEGWVACQMCQRWAHDSCADYNEKEKECAVFLCELCQ